MPPKTRKKRGTPEDAKPPSKKSLPGSQTLWRALNIMEAVANGATRLGDLADAVKLTRSTTHRLAAALVDRRYLGLLAGVGYNLGPKLLELGFQAQDQTDLSKVARPHLEGLAARSRDAAHLGVLDGFDVLYLDKISGARRIEFRSRIGERQPVRSTGLGKALLLDASEARWREAYAAETSTAYAVDLETWLSRMREYVAQGFAYDLEENEDRVRCVAAPVRGGMGEIVASISVSSAAQYMSADRMKILTRDVQDTANAISRELGWNPAHQRTFIKTAGSES